jgi:hypothetical protein
MDKASLLMKMSGIFDEYLADKAKSPAISGMTKDESVETAADEIAEPLEEQVKEAMEGTEEHPEAAELAIAGKEEKGEDEEKLPPHVQALLDKVIKPKAKRPIGEVDLGITGLKPKMGVSVERMTVAAKPSVKPSKAIK